jgi:hypothetical protein
VPEVGNLRNSEGKGFGVGRAIDLGQLRCAKIADVGPDATAGQLGGWAAGIEIFRVSDVLYLPEFGLPVCNGFVPEEAINYAVHLNVRLGQAIKAGRLSTSGPHLPLGNLECCERAVCILGNIYSKNFGHWTEELLKVILLEEFGFDGCYVFPTWYPRFAHESLSLLGITTDRVVLVDKPAIYRTAFFTTVISHFRAHKFPAVIRRLREQLYAAAQPGQGQTERVWVERGSGANNGRGVINDDEVQSFLERHGFVRVDFGQHSFKDQISIDRGIEVLMGPHGSAAVHCGFMQSNRDVIEIFSPEYINPSVIQLCLALQHGYQQVVPAHSWHSPYKYGTELMVDIDQLELALLSVARRR